MPISLEHVSYTYFPGTPFETEALRDVSLTIRDGEFVGLMGRTGCGKSTLIQLLAGLLIPSGGRILIDGADIHAPGYDRSALRRILGIVFQYPENQLFETSVERDVAFGLKHSGLSAEEKARRVQWALDTVGFDFEQIREQPPLALSGGQKRLVAIAGVLAAKPRILIFDEPIAGLDPLGRESFLALTDRLHRAGVTILMASHNADCLAEHANRLLVLDGGGVALDGAPRQVFSDIMRMERMHIGVSEPRRIAALLADRGVRLPEGIVRYDELLSELTTWRRGGERP